MSQEQKGKAAPAQVEETESAEAKDLTNEELSEETDDLLAEIDDVLEENAEEFVQGYKQMGGE